MIQKHYAYLGKEIASKMEGERLDESNWDTLRNDEVESPYSIEKTVDAYEDNCKKAVGYREIARLIVDEIARTDRVTNKIVSCGVGKGILEWHLKNICPQLYVECTDYTKNAIDLLKKVFISMDNAYTFDMLNGDYSELGAESTIVMYRVSTEFDAKQWETIFAKMYNADIRHIVFVPTGLDTSKTMFIERIRHILNEVLGRKELFCGWLYSEDEFLKFFKGNREKPMYNVMKKIDVDNTAIYFLEKHSCFIE